VPALDPTLPEQAGQHQIGIGVAFPDRAQHLERHLARAVDHAARGAARPLRARSRLRAPSARSRRSARITVRACGSGIATTGAARPVGARTLAGGLAVATVRTWPGVGAGVTRTTSLACPPVPGLSLSGAAPRFRPAPCLRPASTAGAIIRPASTGLPAATAGVPATAPVAAVARIVAAPAAARPRCAPATLATVRARRALVLLGSVRVLALLLLARGTSRPAAVDVAVGDLLPPGVVGTPLCRGHSTTAPGSRRAPRAQSRAGIIFLPGGCTLPHRTAVVAVPTYTPVLRTSMTRSGSSSCTISTGPSLIRWPPTVVHAPGAGVTERILRSTARAGWSQRTRASSTVTLGA